MEKEGGAWEGRLCKEIKREEVDVQLVQKPPAKVAAMADEEGAFTWASHREQRWWKWEQETAGWLGEGSREGGKGMG